MEPDVEVDDWNDVDALTRIAAAAAAAEVKVVVLSCAVRLASQCPGKVPVPPPPKYSVLRRLAAQYRIRFFLRLTLVDVQSQADLVDVLSQRVTQYFHIVALRLQHSDPRVLQERIDLRDTRVRIVDLSKLSSANRVTDDWNLLPRKRLAPNTFVQLSAAPLRIVKKGADFYAQLSVMRRLCHGSLRDYAIVVSNGVTSRDDGIAWRRIADLQRLFVVITGRSDALFLQAARRLESLLDSCDNSTLTIEPSHAIAKKTRKRSRSEVGVLPGVAVTCRGAPPSVASSRDEVAWEEVV